MNYLKLILVLFLLSGIVLACDKKEESSCSIAYSTELQAEINALTTAAQLYGTSPTVANCVAYKTSYQVYIDKLEPYGNCSAFTVQQRSDFDAALSAAKSSANALNCQ